MHVLIIYFFCIEALFMIVFSVNVVIADIFSIFLNIFGRYC